MTELAERLRELHQPWGIHEECDCKWDDEKDGYGHPEGADVVNCGEYQTCEPASFSICRHCCLDDDEQSEQCVDTHDHGPGKPICETAAILDDCEAEL